MIVEDHLQCVTLVHPAMEDHMIAVRVIILLLLGGAATLGMNAFIYLSLIYIVENGGELL